MTRSPRMLLGAAATALALVLGACGSGPPDAGPGDPTTSAAPRADIVAPADLEVGESITVGLLSERMNAALREAGTMTMVTGDGSTARVAFHADSVDFAAAEPDGEVRLVDGVLYLEAAGGLAELAGDHDWLRVDPGADDAFSQATAPMIDQLTSAADPTAALGDPAKPSTLIAAEGQTFTFETIVPAEEVLAAAEEAFGAEGAAEAGDVGDYVFRHVIGPNWLPMSLTSATADIAPFTIEYGGFGEPVDIMAPPAEDVGTVADDATP